MLEGRLADFSLPEIFQLLAWTRKTGTLRVRHDDTEGRVVFRDGQVVSATDDVRHPVVAARMVAAGLVDDADLAAARQAGGDGTADGALAALADAGTVDAATVTGFRRQQAEDAVYALMSLAEATFHVDVSEPASTPGEVALDTEQLIAEGARRHRDWAELRRRVPGGSVPALVADPPGQDPVTLDRDQWRLVAHIDGHRRVGDLVDLLGDGEYATVGALAGLVDAGVVVVAADAAATVHDAAATAHDPAAAVHDAARPSLAPTSLQATLAHGAQLDDHGRRSAALADDAGVGGERGAAPGPLPAPRPPRAAVSPPADAAPAAPTEAAVDEPAVDEAAPEEPAPDASAVDAPGARPRLTRDDDVNKAMLLRLLDGVKGV